MKSVVVFYISSLSANSKVNLDAYHLRKTLAQNTIRIFYGVVKIGINIIAVQGANVVKALVCNNNRQNL